MKLEREYLLLIYHLEHEFLDDRIRNNSNLRLQIVLC